MIRCCSPRIRFFIFAITPILPSSIPHNFSSISTTFFSTSIKFKLRIHFYAKLQMVALASNVVHMASSSCALPMAMAGWGSLPSHKPQSLLPLNANRTSTFHLPSLSSSYASSTLQTTAAVASGTTGVSSADQNQTKNKYYFVVANAKFMLDEEEHFKELMFERLRMFGERNMEQDFWLVIEPKFLDKFPNITKRLKRPAVALVSTNGPWITFMKLRLDRVLADSYEAETFEEALASNPTKIEFEKPDKWVAPYKKYEYGWWESFLPSASSTKMA